METSETPKVKRLPRTPNGKFAPTFQANGTTYRIQDVDSISAAKWNKMKRYSVLALSALRGDGIVKFINEIEAALNSFIRDKASMGGAFSIIETARKNIGELSEDRKDPVFSACATFIIPDGGDEVNFSDAVAEKAISDWEAEGYTYPDFFLLLLKQQTALNEYLPSGILTDSARVTGTEV
jgi:hypothetical protein